MRGRHANAPNTIDNCHSQEDIADLFAASYRQLYSSVNYSDEEITSVRSCVDEKLSKTGIDHSFIVTSKDVLRSVNLMA